MRSFSHEPGDLTSVEACAHPLAFYRQFFAGWTQEDLSADAPIVYQRLRRKGLIRRRFGVDYHERTGTRGKSPGNQG